MQIAITEIIAEHDQKIWLLSTMQDARQPKKEHGPDRRTERIHEEYSNKVAMQLLSKHSAIQLTTIS